ELLSAAQASDRSFLAERVRLRTPRTPRRAVSPEGTTMRMALTLLALGLCPLTTGCRLAVNAARNLAYEPMRYTDDAVECYRNHRLACEAWDHVAEANGGKAFSR